LSEDLGIYKMSKFDALMQRGAKKSEPQAVYKYDQGKPRLDLVPPGIIEAVGVVRTYGVSKYNTTQGWQQVEPERYTAALMRHLCKFLRDPYSKDKESGLPHLWHMACNIAFLIEFYEEVEQRE
jgi:hypothetical protein